jgi:hypothetical protein
MTRAPSFAGFDYDAVGPLAVLLTTALKMLNLTICAVLAGAIGAHAVRAQTSSTSQVKGIVVYVNGEWEVSGKRLKFLDTVAAGEQSTGSSGTLTIWFHGPPTVFSCSSQCKITLAPKAGSSVSETVTRMTGELLAVFDSERDELVVAASRGLEPELKEAVLRTGGGQVDVGPAFREMDPGSYQVSIQPALSRQTSTHLQAVNYTSGAPVMVSTKGLKPGLYILSTIDASHQVNETQAWVLISSPDQFSKDSDAFNVLLETIKQWPSEIDPRAPRAIQRAYLQVLAAREEEKESLQ